MKLLGNQQKQLVQGGFSTGITEMAVYDSQGNMLPGEDNLGATPMPEGTKVQELQGKLKGQPTAMPKQQFPIGNF